MRAHRLTVGAGVVFAGVLGVCPPSPVSCPLAEAQELKVAFVDVGKLFDGYEKTKQNEVVLEGKGKQQEAQLQQRLEELKKLRTGMELLNNDAREGRQRQIEEKADELQRLRNSAGRTLRSERDKMAADILEDIQRAVEDYAQANAVTVVLDERSVLFGVPAIDVTDPILQILNARAGKKP
jgi:Skp family chaperone for outer membrane proteins